MSKQKFAVTVLAGPNGEIIQQNPNKPEYGSLALRQNGFVLRNNFLNFRSKTSFISGTMEELRNFVDVFELKPDSEVPGKLYDVEQFTPFYENQEPKLNPQTRRACLIDGAMVWRKTFYDQSGTAEDKYLVGEPSEGDIIPERTRTEIPSILRSLMLS